MSSGSVRQEGDFQTPSSPKRAEHWNIGTPAGVMPPSPPRVPPFQGFNTSRITEEWDQASVGGSNAASDLALVVEEMRMCRERQERKDAMQFEKERAERVFRDAEMAARDSKDRAERAERAVLKEAELAAQMNRDELERADRAERDRKQEASEHQRKLELELLMAATAKKEAKVQSIFSVKPQAPFPKFGDQDFDVEEHLEAFEDLCNLANPHDGIQPGERLRLFGTTLEGSRLRCFKAIIKEAKREGRVIADPVAVFKQVTEQFFTDFHESVPAKQLKAIRRYQMLEKGRGSYQTFSVAWSEALAELRTAGIIKNERELFLDYVCKVGQVLKLKILENRRFWPARPVEGELTVFREPTTWQEACIVAKEFCSLEELEGLCRVRLPSQGSATQPPCRKSECWRERFAPPLWSGGPARP
jgi:hypothetical protein